MLVVLFLMIKEWSGMEEMVWALKMSAAILKEMMSKRKTSIWLEGDRSGVEASIQVIHRDLVSVPAFVSKTTHRQGMLQGKGAKDRSSGPPKESWMWNEEDAVKDTLAE